MKRKLNLMNINNDSEMARKDMTNLKVGLVGSMCANYSACACGCKWVNNGGSNTEDNYTANESSEAGWGLHSPGVDYTNAANIDLIS